MEPDYAFCANCAKEFFAHDQSLCRCEWDKNGAMTEVWLFCSARCREEFKEQE